MRKNIQILLKINVDNGQLCAMRSFGPQLSQILLGLALLAALMWNFAYGAEVRWVQMDEGAGGTRAEIGLDAAAEYKTMRLSNPARFVVDFPASRLGSRFAVPPGVGVVRAVRNGQPEPGTVRIVFDLAESVTASEPRIQSGPDGVWLVVEWPGTSSVPAQASVPTQASTSVPTPPAVSASATVPPAPVTQDNVLVWPVGDPIERIAIPTPKGTVPALPAAAPDSRSQLLPEPDPEPQSRALPGASSPHSATGPPASPALDPIAQIAAATQSGAAEQLLHAAATPVAVSTPASPEVTAPVSTPGPQQSAPPHTAVSPPVHTRQTTPALRPLVIAIDPGHGGRDPGAIGPGGTYEKNIVLLIAKELARQINATPGMRAHLIRNSDTYVELPERARLARKAKADMFVSIHADAAHNHSVQGASVYTLSTTGASSQHARWLADRENSADLIGGVKVENTLSSVLLDLAHSGHMKASQDAANHVLNGLSKVGKAHRNQVEYANFSVLRNADMPAMLVETGFISNAAEEKRLQNPAYQRRLATAILNGIKTFFRNQPPPGTVFAAN